MEWKIGDRSTLKVNSEIWGLVLARNMRVVQFWYLQTKIPLMADLYRYEIVLQSFTSSIRQRGK